MDYTTLERRLQAEVDAVVDKNTDVFSAVVGISDAKKDFRWQGAAGTACPDQKVGMTPETPFFIASITKIYTAAATMILEERGLLSLDDPISKHLPDTLLEGLHLYKGREYTDQLRIYHLISQTSGLPDYFTEKPKGGKSIYDLIVAGSDEQWGVEEVARIVKSSLSPRFPPEPKELEATGKKAYYSDTNYQLLGALVESVTQKCLGEVFDEMIIGPFELSSTYLHGSVVSDNQPPANIYYKTRPLNLDKAMTSFGPDGGMVSNVGDSLKFLRNFMEGKLFTRTTTLERMKSWRSIFFPFQYGLGLMRLKLPRIMSPFSVTPELIGHSGASSAFLFRSDIGQVYIAGTLNQLENQGRPVQLMLKIIKLVDKELS